MKNIIKTILVFLIAFSISITSFGAEIKCSSWARPIVEEAVSKNYVPEAVLQKATEVATRKEFCSIIMKVYETKTGTVYIPKGESPFKDEKSSTVLSAVELGLFSGINETQFDPYGSVSREQMATVVARLFTKLGKQFTPLQDATEKFDDDQWISPWAKDSVSLLKKSGALSGNADGKFNPKADATIEQIITVIMQTEKPSEVKNVSGAESIKVGDTVITLGDTKAQVLASLGNPGRIDNNIYGFERYVYNSNYDKFVMVGIKNDKVAEIYTNAKTFGYGKITSATTYKDMNFKGYDEYSSEKGVYKTDRYVLSIFFDVLGNRKVDAIYLRDSNLTEAVNFYNGKNDAYAEKELFDIINSARVKNNAPVLTRNIYSDAVAKTHATELQSFLRNDYNSLKGLTPFERMDNANIKFSLAAENICTEVKGDAIEIYGWWMSNVATRSNIIEDSFTDIGIGCVGSSQKSGFYTTIDLFCK